MDGDTSIHFYRAKDDRSSLPISLEEPYQSFQEAASPGDGRKVFDARLGLFAGAAVVLGLLMGLVLLEALALLFH